MGRTNWIAIGLCLLLPVQPASGQTHLRFGVLPYAPAANLERDVGPLIKAISERLQQPIEIKTRPSFSMFLEALLAEEFDIALIQPFDYVQIRKLTDYRPIVRKANNLRAQLVTADKSVLSLNDLRGQIIAFPARRAAVTLLALRSMELAGLDSDSYQAHFYAEHTSCLLAVVNNQAKACVTIADLVPKNSPRMELYSLPLSESIPHILIVARTGQFSDLEKLQNLLLEFNHTESGRALLGAAYLQALVPATDQDYAIVSDIYGATIDIQSYTREEQQPSL